jgi:hypothetical protein
VRGVEFVLVYWVFGVIVLGSYTLLLLNIMRRRSPAFFEKKKIKHLGGLRITFNKQMFVLLTQQLGSDTFTKYTLQLKK